jgi:hypothetical protein
MTNAMHRYFDIQYGSQKVAEEKMSLTGIAHTVYLSDLSFYEHSNSLTCSVYFVGVTAVLTLSAISLDSRTDLPKV